MNLRQSPSCAAHIEAYTPSALSSRCTSEKARKREHEAARHKPPTKRPKRVRITLAERLKTAVVQP